MLSMLNTGADCRLAVFLSSGFFAIDIGCFGAIGTGFGVFGFRLKVREIFVEF
jgi:hypothetical protein